MPQPQAVEAIRKQPKNYIALTYTQDERNEAESNSLKLVALASGIDNSAAKKFERSDQAKREYFQKFAMSASDVEACLEPLYWRSAETLRLSAKAMRGVSSWTKPRTNTQERNSRCTSQS